MAYISLGSNLGDRYNTLTSAIQKLTSDEKIKLVSFSSIYETDPVGYEDQDMFLNMVIKIETAYNALELLDICMKTELDFGRKREIKWGPRTLDLDILFFNQENIESEKLIVPHPRICERAFVMIPLLEIDHDLRMTNNDRPLKAWLTELPEREGVRIWKQKSGEDVFEPIES